MIYVIAALVIMIGAFMWLRRKHSPVESLLFISSATLPLEWNVQVGSSARVGVYDLVCVLCLLVWFLTLLKLGGRIRVKRSIANISLLCASVIIWSAAAWLLHNDNPSLVYAGWKSLKMIIFGIYFILGIQLAYQTLQVQQQCFNILLIACMCNGAIGIIQRMSGGAWLTGIYTNQLFLGLFTPLPERLLEGTRWLTLEVQSANGYRAHGTFLDQTWYAPFMLAAFCLWLGFTIRQSNAGLSQRVRLIGLLVCAAGLFASSVRGAFVGMVGALIVAFFFAPKLIIRTTTQVAKAALGVTFIVLSVSIFSSDRLSQIGIEVDRIVSRLATVTSPENQIEFLGRVRLWELAMNRVFTQSPIFGKGQLITPSEAGWVGDSSSDTDVQLPLHSQYLALIYYGGFPAFFLFLLSCALFWWSSHRISKQPGLHGQVGVGMALTTIALLINGLVSDWFSYASTATAALFWYIGAYTVAVYKIKSAIKLSSAYVVQQQHPLAP
jgi:hypothetical protein